jgi:hypothetical protein
MSQPFTPWPSVGDGPDRDFNLLAINHTDIFVEFNGLAVDFAVQRHRNDSSSRSLCGFILRDHHRTDHRRTRGIAAKATMFFPHRYGGLRWTVIKSDCKMRARLSAMRYVLHRLPYPNKY